jgi:hypothetical protein
MSIRIDAQTVIQRAGTRPASTTYSQAQVDEVQRLYRLGASRAQIVAQTGVPSGSLYYLLRLAPGVSARRRPRDRHGRFTVRTLAR